MSALVLRWNMLRECNSRRLIVLDLDRLRDWGASAIDDFCQSYSGTVILSARTGEYSGKIHRRPLGRPTDLAMRDLMRARGLHPWESLFITGSPREAALVGAIGVATILWGDPSEVLHNHLPDFLAQSHDTLRHFLAGHYYGYFGEMLAHGGSATGLFHLYDQVHLLNPAVSARVIVGGRYFPKDDRRHAIHPLSQKIIGFKRESYRDMLADLTNYSLDVLRRTERWDFITAVPGHDASNRLGTLFALSAKQRPDLYARVRIEAGLLTVAHSYPSQKNSGNWLKRAINVSGAFQAVRTVTGIGVLVDDVITSGATVMECVKVLTMAGADKVLVVEFATSQDILKPTHDRQLICGSCGRLCSCVLIAGLATPFLAAVDFVMGVSRR